MRRAVIAAVLAWLVVPAAACALTKRHVTRVLTQAMAGAGPHSGIYVEDLADGSRFYARRAATPRLPASVEKLWTTTGEQATFGDDGTLVTSVLANRRVRLDGTLDGDLYLRGGGDPTLTTDDMTDLASQLDDAGLSRVTGSVIGDEGFFDDRRGVPSSGYGPSPDVEPLGALMLDRGLSGKTSPYYQPRPAQFAAAALTKALRRRGVTVKHAPGEGATPGGALALASVESPTIAELIALQNVPSDNYIAETMIKAIGAADEEPGTTAHGAEQVMAAVGELFDLEPRVVDGSGLSRSDASSPRQIVDLLAGKFADEAFFDSLAVAGESGTLEDRMRGTRARGNCRGKTGTLHDVSNLAGYCRVAGGDTLAFAILNNAVNPYTARSLQDKIVVALSRFRR